MTGPKKRKFVKGYSQYTNENGKNVGRGNGFEPINGDGSRGHATPQMENTSMINGLTVNYKHKM